MSRPFAHRTYDPARGGSAVLRWYEIRSPVDGTLYLLRLILVRFALGGALLHRILGADWGRDLHDHPWPFASFVLRGWYVEEVPDPELYPDLESVQDAACVGRVVTVRRRVRWLNLKRARAPHRIVEVSPDCVTLVFHGPKSRTWGFYSLGDGWVRWREYLGVP